MIVELCPKREWPERKNGELLAFAEKSGFQAFLTLDRGIEYQQNLEPRKIAVVLVCARSSRLADLLPQIPDILEVLASLEPGQLVKIGS
jgi:hypothetical protein